jgi:hypothetical protein
MYLPVRTIRIVSSLTRQDARHEAMPQLVTQHGLRNTTDVDTATHAWGSVTLLETEGELRWTINGLAQWRAVT